MELIQIIILIPVYFFLVGLCGYAFGIGFINAQIAMKNKTNKQERMMKNDAL